MDKHPDGGEDSRRTRRLLPTLQAEADAEKRLCAARQQLRAEQVTPTGWLGCGASLVWLQKFGMSPEKSDLKARQISCVQFEGL